MTPIRTSKKGLKTPRHRRLRQKRLNFRVGGLRVRSIMMVDNPQAEPQLTPSLSLLCKGQLLPPARELTSAMQIFCSTSHSIAFQYISTSNP
jgi:hypothetical protein